MTAEAQKLYICERYGTGRDQLHDPSKCSPKPGTNGPYPQIKADYERQTRALKAFENSLKSANAALSKAEREAARNAQGTIEQRKAEAEAALPEAIAQQAQAQADYDRYRDALAQATRGATGMLSQLKALEELSRISSMMFLAHLSIGALFFLIELLPVIVKILSSIGEPSYYEVVEKLEKASLIEEVRAARSDERQRIEAESRKRRIVDDDMLAREKRLSLKANVHVERRMEEILDAALTEWGERVSANLYRENATAQAGPADPQWPDPSPNAVFTSASHDMERSTLRVPYSQLTEVTIDRPGRLRKSGYRRPSEPQR